MNIIDRDGVVHSRSSSVCWNYPRSAAGVIRASTPRPVTCLVCVVTEPERPHASQQLQSARRVSR